MMLCSSATRFRRQAFVHKNLVKSRLKRTLIAASIGALSLGANAAGLGRITVLSGLGQPLRAEVDISATLEELQNMTARLASAEAFRQAGIDFAPSVSGLRMSIERRGGGAVVRVTSDRPINEPFVDMLVELNWSAGRLIREYTFLLDPPDLGSARAAAPVASPEMRPGVSGGAYAAQPRRQPVARVARPAAAPAAGAGRTYMVQPGDTLNRIAAETRPEGVSMEQMLLALFQGNRSAFDADNMNRLQAGKILRIPDADSARQLAGDGSKQQVVAHSSDFGRYRQKLAEQAAGMPAKEAPVQQGSSGRIGAKVEDRAPAAAGATDQLKVSKSDEGLKSGSAPGGEKSVARLQALEEDLVSRDKALREANTRLAELEKSIKELQRLVELKSQGMAQAQSDAPRVDAPVVPPPVAEVPPPAPGTAAEAPKAPEPIAEAKPVPQPESKPVPPEPPKAPQAQATAPEDMSLLLGGGGILALLLGWGGYKIYQRRNVGGAPTTTPALSEFGDGANSVFGSAGGQSVDTGSTSQIQTDFSQSGLSSIDTDEGVDPVAEADVYMAYGRDAQAEEILLDALKTDPGRTGVHLKLLEIYAQRKNLKQFETTATELYSLTGGNGPDWEKAASLGRKFDPDSPLYRIPAPGSAPIAPPVRPVAASALATAAIAAGETGFVQAGQSRPGAREPIPGQADFIATPTASDDPLESPSQLKDTWALPGELNQYASLEDIERAASPTPATTLTPNIPDTSVLDFDLDLAADTHASASTVAASQAGGGLSGGLDFDLGLDMDTSAVPATAGATLVAGDALARRFEETSTRPQRVAEDFSLPDPSDLDFEISSEFGEREVSPGADATVDVDLTATLSDDALRLPLDTATVDLEKTSFDSSLLDFDFELDEKSDASPSPARSFPSSAANLSDIDLELNTPTSTRIEMPDPGPPTEPPLDLDLQQEVATKLELARAYEEMGDKDGARELVEEVLREGTGRQKDEAQAILARLS